MLKMLKRIIKFFHKNENYYAPLQYEIEYEKKPLPPWEEIVEMCYGQGLSNLSDYTIEKVFYANAKDFRAVIYKKKDMYFIIYERLFAWDDEDEYEINEYLSGKGLPGYWFPIDNGISVFDSIETAEKEILSMSEFNKPKYKIYHRSYANIEEIYDDFKDYIRNIRLENNKIFIEHNEDILVIEKGVNGSFYTYRNGEKEKGDWDDQDLLDYALEFVKLHCRDRF